MMASKQARKSQRNRNIFITYTDHETQTLECDTTLLQNHFIKLKTQPPYVTTSMYKPHLTKHTTM